MSLILGSSTLEWRSLVEQSGFDSTFTMNTTSLPYLTEVMMPQKSNLKLLT